MVRKSECKKPSGKSVSLLVGGSAPTFIEKNLPSSKTDIEQHYAELFCFGDRPLNQHRARYGKFSDLKPQSENSIDFQVNTSHGARWLELVEFAPLVMFGGKYEEVSKAWDVNELAKLFVDLIKKKNSKNYGGNVILLVYQTDDKLFLPPSLIRAMASRLTELNLCFESIYSVSPNGLVMEVWPGNRAGNGPVTTSGVFLVGLK